MRKHVEIPRQAQRIVIYGYVTDHGVTPMMSMDKNLQESVLLFIQHKQKISFFLTILIKKEP